MKSRTDEEMLAIILDFAREDERVRAVLMNGSRVNPRVRHDMFCDFDVVFMVTDVTPFAHRDAVVPPFGEPLIVQEPERFDPKAPPGDQRYTYLMQFTDGVRIDLQFHTLERLHLQLKDSLTVALLDKDGMVPNLPDPEESSYLPEPPSPDEYDRCVNEFLFGLGSQTPKTLWRDQPSLSLMYVEFCMRSMLFRMYEWEFGAREDNPLSIGKWGKHLKELLPAEEWNLYLKTYCDADIDNIWDSLAAFHELFGRVATRVGKAFGHCYPAEQAERILRHVEHVRRLPPDAETIYSD